VTGQPLVNALLFACLGIVIFAVAASALSKAVPGHLWKEILEKQNVALAILVGAASIGICLIIAAAMH
jgi:uncharacterized membrane protein YjfL (UPF0719 family)